MIKDVYFPFALLSPLFFFISFSPVCLFFILGSPLVIDENFSPLSAFSFRCHAKKQFFAVLRPGPEDHRLDSFPLA
jgi:hypothetical protein